jgi:hypothetical protein
MVPTEALDSATGQLPAVSDPLSTIGALPYTAVAVGLVPPEVVCRAMRALLRS